MQHRGENERKSDISKYHFNNGQGNEKNKKFPLRKFQKIVEQKSKIDVSNNTIEGYIKDNNILTSVPIKKSLLRYFNIKNIKWIARQIIKISQNSAKSIIFSNE